MRPAEANPTANANTETEHKYLIAGAGVDPFAAERAAAALNRAASRLDRAVNGAQRNARIRLAAAADALGRVKPAAAAAAPAAPRRRTRRYQPLPPPEEVAQLLSFRRAGPNDWRGPHLCGGEKPGDRIRPNAGYSVSRKPDGNTRVTCHYGCDWREAYAALRHALGLEAYVLDDAPPPPPTEPPQRKRKREPTPADWQRVNAANADRRNRPPASVPLIPGTGWPRLDAPLISYHHQLADLPDGWVAWTDYTLPDGKQDTVFRPFPPRAHGAKSVWSSKPEGAERRDHSHLTPALFPHAEAVDATAVIIAEGEKAAAAIACAAPAGVAVGSSNAAAGMASLDLRFLARYDRIIIWPDRDGAGIEAASQLAHRLFDAGHAAQVGVVPAMDIIAAAIRNGCGPAEIGGIDAADLTPEDIRRLVAHTLDTAAAAENCTTAASGLTVGVQGAPTGIPSDSTEAAVVQFLARPLQAGVYACPNRRVYMYQDSSGHQGERYFPCRDCWKCGEYLKMCDMRRYDAGIVAGRRQTIIVYPYATPKEERKFRVSQHRRVARQIDGGAPNVAVVDGRTLHLIYHEELPPRALELTAAALARAGKGELQTRELPAPGLYALLPEARMQHKHLDGDEKNALYSVVWNHWPAQFLDVDPDWAMGDGAFDENAESPPPHAPNKDTLKTQARLALGRAYAAYHNATDWLNGVIISLESWRELVAAAASGDLETTKAAVREIREITGYRGPAGLLVAGASGGQRECDKLVRLTVAGLPMDEEITEPSPQRKRKRRFSRGLRSWDGGGDESGGTAAPAAEPEPEPEPDPRRCVHCDAELEFPQFFHYAEFHGYTADAFRRLKVR